MKIPDSITPVLLSAFALVGGCASTQIDPAAAAKIATTYAQSTPCGELNITKERVSSSFNSHCANFNEDMAMLGAALSVSETRQDVFPLAIYFLERYFENPDLGSRLEPTFIDLGLLKEWETLDTLRGHRDVKCVLDQGKLVCT